MSKIELFNRKVMMIIPVLIAILASSCKKYLDIETPRSEIEKEVVFSNDVTATAAVLGIYPQLISESGFISGTPTSLLALAGLSSDELINYPQETVMLEFENNRISPTNANITTLWQSMYSIIYQANSIIEGIESSNGLSPSIGRQLTGEALFVRGICYFHLVNLYGDVPLVLTTDYRANTLVKRIEINEVYEQLIVDLESARELLVDDYIGSPERLRPNKFAASAFLARVYLYRENWSKAELMATEVIDNKALYTLKDSLQDVFLKNSSESIWQLQSVWYGDNNPTNEAIYFDPQSVLSFNVLRSGLFEEFEVGDRRASVWIDYVTGYNAETVYYPRKYKNTDFSTPATEYSSVLRLAEQHLIRAEARAMQNKLLGEDGAEFDINVIRKRALLLPTTAVTQDEIIKAIMKERRIELIAEGGHRWFDLKRWDKATEVLGPIKGSHWQGTDVFYPLPQKEMDNNPNLKPQNGGY